MFEVTRIGRFGNRFVEPISFPINVLQMLAFEPQLIHQHRPYNYFEGLRDGVGHGLTWAEISRVYSPWFFAPEWDSEDVAWMADSPIVDVRGEFARRRVDISQFFDRPSWHSGLAPEKLDIIHVDLPQPSVESSRGTDSLLDIPAIGEEGLARLGEVSSTRLIILQVSQFDVRMVTAAAERLSSFIGSPVMVLSGVNPLVTGAFLGSFYREIMHNLPLEEAVELAQRNLQSDVFVNLVLSEDDNDVLRLDRYFNVIEERRRSAIEQADQLSRLENLDADVGRFLHPRQRARLQSLLQARRSELSLAQDALEYMGYRHAQILSGNWIGESTGALPLAESVAEISEIEASVQATTAQIGSLAEEIAQETQRAPRALNANFAEASDDTSQGRVIGRREALIAGKAYDFLIDIGPRWSQIESITSGNTDWPEQAFPPDGDGDIIDVVLVSEDFRPNLVTGQIWVPRRTGRSSAIIAGARAATSGPVRLRLTTPELPDSSDSDTREARGRLCLYYETNLLQSAIVRIGVARSGQVTLDEDNDIHVDFVLTSTFQELRERFARRQLQLAGQDSGFHPVKVSFTLNDDGRGGHRIVFKSRLLTAPTSTSTPVGPQQCPTEAWAPYDPAAGRDALELARQRLFECFFARDAGTGETVRDADGKRIRGLDANLGKSRDDFRRDLAILARVGRDLLTSVLQDVNVESDVCNPRRWRQQLQRLLVDASIVQIGRPEQSQYVLPWGLMYDYPLMEAEDAKLRLCPVVDDMLAGDRQIRSRCPYHDDRRANPTPEPWWHSRNVLCPYGFWGLRHVIEEPLSVRKELGVVRNDVRVGPGLPISMAITTDPELEGGVASHLERIRSIPGITLEPSHHANTWETVKSMMRSPSVVYFLCHGLAEGSPKKVYLGLGAPECDRPQRVYPGDLAQWADMELPEGPDIDAWDERRPFVFINGCHTLDLAPGQLLDFTKPFSTLQAGGLLGTEVSVQLPVATAVAESLFRKLTANNGTATAGAASRSISVGEALRQVRWELACKGNLLGLAYTLYGLSDLRMVRT